MKSLWPREHGAYAQLGAPLIVALATPSWAGGALAAAACCAFLAHEPLLVVLGHRGRRLRESLGRRAAVRLGILATLAVVLGVLGLAASAAARPFALAVAVPAAAGVVLSWRRAAHTREGELVVAIALTGAAAPVAAAAGAGGVATTWLAWSVGFVASVFAVHAILDRRRSLLPCGLLVAAAAAQLVVPFSAALPLAATAAVVGLRPPAPRRLRTAGVALAIAACASAALAIAA